MADGEAASNRCPPGGAQGVQRLSRILGVPALPLDPERGTEGERALAVIDEAWCIGCTLCIKACPVDCIVGAPKLMHTVIDSLCTGCELCIPVCPVDCITMPAVTPGRSGWQAWSPQQADEARARYAWHQERLQRDKHEEAQRMAARAQARRVASDHGAAASPAQAEGQATQSEGVEAPLARSRQRRGSSGEG